MQPRARASATQDRAAGGRERRRKIRPDGTTGLASVDIKELSTGRYYAYLRSTFRARTVTEYVGPVAGASHEDRLIHAWLLVHQRDLLGLRRPKRTPARQRRPNIPSR